MDMIDWSLAQRIGELLAGTPPEGGILSDSVAPLAEDFARRVSDYTGLELPERLPPLEAVDRPAWIAANLQTMRPMMESVAKRTGGKLTQTTKLRGARLGLPEAMRALSGVWLGAQVGAMAGMLSQRVLGQYDLALLDPTVQPRLLLVAPNLAQAASSMHVEREDLLSWVTIHEITHAVQFSGAPWLREHLAGMISELLEGLEVSVSATQMLRLPDLGNMRELAERLRRGEILRVALGEDRWALVERMQATMSLVEGHAEHVMDAVGAEVLPSLPRLREAMTGRRETRGLPWRVLSRLLGLELKMRQYDIGKRFCDAVVAAGGESGAELLARAWQSPQSMPSATELESPQIWLRRMGGERLASAS
jgi:coenzyme F420 biosynthesis associated uncharacterized protein